MSHRGVDPQRSVVAFSWEDSPGVPKYFMQQNFSSSNYHFNRQKIPPPPPYTAFRPPIISKSSSMRGNDPFIAALIKCTKSSNCVGNSKMPPIDYEQRKSSALSKGSKKGSSLCIFSCKQASSEVKVGNIVSLSNLPPLPRPRGRSYKALTNEDED